MLQGLRLDDLGTKKLSWLDLLLVVIYSPAAGPLGRAMLGERALWGIPEYLLALAVDVLQEGNWQRGGGKGPRPTRVPRPEDQEKIQAFGSDPIPIKDFQSWWDEEG